MTDHSLSISLMLPTGESLASKLSHELIEFLPVGIYLCNASGVLVAYNQKAADIWGEAPDLQGEVVKYSGAYRLLTPEGLQVPHDQSPMAAILLSRQAVSNFRLVVERRDGSRLPVLSNIVPLFDEHGAMAGFMNTLQDLREQAAQEQAQENLENALFQSQRMELVGQLTSGLAHDFKNQLASLSMGLELMGREIKRSESERLARYFDICKESLERATSLSENLLLFARSRPRKLERVDPNQTLIGMASLLRRELGASITLTLELAPDASFLRANRQQLESAIVNLAINARDAMPEGGKLVIGTANRSLDRSNFLPHNANFMPGRYMAFSIRDSGSGIADDMLQHIFTPFYTTKEPGKGTGLGLTMVRGFVTDMNGQLSISSSPDQGTCIELYFPCYGTEHSLAITGSDQ